MSSPLSRLHQVSDHFLLSDDQMSPSPTKGEEGSGLEDEYGVMDSSGETIRLKLFTLESGIVLHDVPVRYNTWGQLNSARDNVLVVCHALTGNSRLDTWWGDLLGPGKAFDSDKYFVVCFNLLGSCYGTLGPTEINPATGQRYGIQFPMVTVRDSVALHMRALKEGLHVTGVISVIGGSLGGMQALEWAMMGPGFVHSAAALACGGRHHAWQIGISVVQRRAIYADPNWKEGHFDPAFPPNKGLALARQIAMITYRTHTSFEKKFGRTTRPQGQQGGSSHFGSSLFQVEGYLQHQGDKFLSRFDAHSYVTITKMMDTHDLGRGRGDYHEVLRALKTPILVVGVDSDILYPLSEQQELARHLGNSVYVMVTSSEGHDGFLLEQTQIAQAISNFLAR